jgi:hypothetical protein
MSEVPATLAGFANSWLLVLSVAPPLTGTRARQDGRRYGPSGEFLEHGQMGALLGAAIWSGELGEDR